MLSLLFVVGMGACGNLGTCNCTAGALPAGGLPADQTVEGGAQIRVSKAGFTKLTSILPGVINAQLGQGFCLGKGKVLDPGFTGANYCDANPGGACGTGQGCAIGVGLNSLTTDVTNAQNLHIALSMHAATTVHIDGKVVFVPFSCNLGITTNDLSGDVNIGLGTDPATGELTVHLNNVNNLHLGVDFSGCGPLSSIGDFVGDFIDSFIGQFVVQLLTPAIDNIVQGILPHPLGIAGMVDVGKLLQGVSPGTTALMEGRVVPGGYVTLNNNGMSLGVITGLNADEDPTTRTPPLQSEPNLCVPPIAPPNFSATPYNLPKSTRQTFALAGAAEFSGNPDPNADLAMGVSKTTLDLAGHHIVTSGMMCLGVGTSFINQLNVGTVGIFVKSLAALDDTGTAPLLLVTRPQRALNFTIGDNTAASPALTVGVSHLEVDFYAFLYQRYVRAFTLDLSMNLGINLDFEQPPGMPAVIKPMLSGISSQSVELSVLNSDFVKETPDELQQTLPAVFDLVVPLLGNLPDIQVPTFAGFSLSNLTIQHVMTQQDDFLALFASLGAGSGFRNLAMTDSFMKTAVDNMDATMAPFVEPSHGQARLLHVNTPGAEQIVGSFLKKKGGALPKVSFSVDSHDDLGRELEWTWNFNNGLWHTWRPGGEFAIEDRAFALQGKYSIGMKSRVKGDYRTVSEPTYTPVVIDSIAPRIFADQATWNGDSLEVPIVDVVSKSKVQYGWASPGADAPETWVDGGRAKLSRADWDRFQQNGDVALFSKDELGNTTSVIITAFHGQGDGSGCNCNTAGQTPSAGSLVLIGLVGLGLFGSRRRRAGQLGPIVQLARRVITSRHIVTVGLWLGISVVVSLAPGCSCNNPSQSCSTMADCDPAQCDSGEIPFCIDNLCQCSNDIPIGRLGPYSKVAAGPDGSVWVSAYAQSHGDLVVAQATAAGRIPDTAWEWVDGVPDGPVVIPDGKIRSGIAADGPDVGMYTSIAVAPDGTVMVTYFDHGTVDAPNANLKFAARVGGVWQTHIIDPGTGQLSAGSGSVVGMFSSLSLRGDDGRPGVAYLAHVADADGEHAEVRYAAAQTTNPTTASDWTTWTVDTTVVPAADPNSPDVYPLPGGLGLFIDSTRNPMDQSPVVTYYDRANGDLKLARFDTTTGQFKTPVVLDGSMGTDVGWSPSVQVDATGVAHVAYVSATADDLKYITDATGSSAEVVDDGYRIVGQSPDGLPKPEFHFVGDDASLVVPTQGDPMVVYQDSTTQELMLAQRGMDGTWTHMSVAGGTQPWPGAYGFYASATLLPSQLVMSTWVIDQPTGENWVEVFFQPTGVQ